MTTGSLPPVLLAAVWLLITGIIIEAWVPLTNTGSSSDQRITSQKNIDRTKVVLTGSNPRDSDNVKSSSGGYKFGDLTRAIGRKVTGDENYQVGTCG